MKSGLSPAALLLLSACVAAPPAPPPPAPVAVLQPQPAPPPAAAPQAAPPPAPEPPPRAPEIAIVVPPPAPPAPKTLTPEDLIGKQRDEVTTMLGGPDIARREPNAELLLYEGQGCSLLVFLYEPLGGGIPRVEYVEVGPRARDVSRDPACLAGLLRRVAGG